MLRAVSEMNENIQGRPGEQDLPQSQVSPRPHTYAHTYTHLPLRGAHLSCGPEGGGVGCRVVVKTRGKVKVSDPRVGMVVRQVLVTWGTFRLIFIHIRPQKEGRLGPAKYFLQIRQ